MNALTKATGTLLVAAVGVFIAWQVLRRVLPLLIVGAVLLFVYRVAIGTWRRRW